MTRDADIRDRILTPRRMRQLADQLDEAIATMRDWGVRIPENSRLPETSRLLRKVAPTDVFPESRTELIEIAHAVRDAQEFVEIGWVLPSEKWKPIHNSLKDAVFGVRGQSFHTAYRFQSELWVGATLSRSRAFTGVRADGEGKNPDFVLWNGNREYLVDVKRPKSMRNPRGFMSDAARQLHPPTSNTRVTSGSPRYHGSALVVDMTDCLSSELRIQFGVGSPDRASVETEIKGLTDKLRRHVFDDSSQRIRRGRRHIFALITFARMTWWSFDDLSQMHSFRYVLPISFLSGRGGTLRNRRARWLARLIDMGMRETGHLDLGRREVTFD